MTWGTCKEIALQKMFAYMDTAAEPDDGTRILVRAMPAPANEALLRLAAAGYARVKTTNVLRTGEKGFSVPLHALPGFYRLCENGVADAALPGRFLPYLVQADGVLYLPDGVQEVCIRYYEIPSFLTEETADIETLPLSEDVAVLLPFAIAGALYQEEDAAVAASYNALFDAGIAALAPLPSEHKTEFTSETGWV